MKQTLSNKVEATATSVVMLGVPIDNVSMDEAVERIDGFVREGGYHQVATANADFLVNALKDSELRQILHGCALVLADGMPLVLASRFMKSPLAERVTGVDLVPQLAILSARRGYRIFLLGGNPEAAAGAAEFMTALGGHIAGSYSPPMSSLESMDNDEIFRRLDEAAPDILLVAFGNPKQEKWAYRNRERLAGIPVTVGVGGTFDMLAGHIKRAPRWMQKSSLEWVWRLSNEPQRLAKRYALDAFYLAKHLSRQVLLSRLGNKAAHGTVALQMVGSVAVVTAAGRMAGVALRQLGSHLTAAAQRSRSVVVDLSEVDHLSVAAIGLLVRSASEARKRGVGVCLAGSSPTVSKVIEAAHVTDLFLYADTVGEAIRSVSPQRMQLSIEFGEGWAECRVGGEMSDAAPAVREIIRQLLASERRVKFDTTGLGREEADGLMSTVALGRQSDYQLVKGC
ncbi:MAG: WecB/TagA/CpsF family glycosyltransferase [Bryobacteraceae bacterium]